MKLDKEHYDALLHSCTSDSYKIIEYLAQEKQKNKVKNRILFFSTVIAAITSTAALIIQIIQVI